MSNIYSLLLERGFLPIKDLNYRKRVAVSEKGKTYLLDVSDNKRSAQFQVEGTSLLWVKDAIS